MKGEWVYDDQADIWHLIWRLDQRSSKVLTTWCNKEYPAKAKQQHGLTFGMADVLHDECVRKSEEL